MKKKIVLSLLIIVCSIGFIYDINRYFIGRSIINYKCLPCNLQPNYLEYRTVATGIKRYFCLIYNDFETFGHGTSVVYNKEELLVDGLETKNVFSVSDIIGYYYDNYRIFIICVDENNKVRCVIPYSYKNDTIFVEVPFPQQRKELKYVNTIDV